MSAHLKQRFPSDEEIIEILDDIKYGTPYLFEVARDIFQETVDPAAYHHQASREELIQINMAFSEWSLFDFDLGDEMTPIKRAARRDPSLKEFVDTQFYSIFWVIKQDRERGLTRLRDVVTCEDFVVHDKLLAKNERWEQGLLGTRIARVGSEWRQAGQVHLHDNAESRPLPHSDAAGGTGIQNRSAFIGHVQSVLGFDGMYNDSLLDSEIIDTCVAV